MVCESVFRFCLSDRTQWSTVVNTATYHRISFKVENSLNSWVTVRFSTRTVVNGVSTLGALVKWWKETISFFIFDVLLTVHLSIFISVFNQIDAQNLFHNKFYFMPLHVSSTCAHHQEVKIALHSLWYHHSYRCDDTNFDLLMMSTCARNM